MANFWNLSWDRFEDPDYTREFTDSTTGEKSTFLCFADFPQPVEPYKLQPTEQLLEQPHWRVMLLLETTGTDGNRTILKLFPNGNSQAIFCADDAHLLNYDYFLNV